MSADLYIHVLEPPCDEQAIAKFCSNTIGSKHFSWGASHCEWEEAYQVVAGTPQIWIGEVSWLKAALFDEPKDFLPEPVVAVHELIGEDLPELTPGLAEAIMRAVCQDNTTSYSVLCDQDSRKELTEFLIEHRGKRLFTVSW